MILKILVALNLFGLELFILAKSLERRKKNKPNVVKKGKDYFDDLKK